MNSLSWFHITEDEYIIEYPGRQRTFFEKILNFVYLGGEHDMVDGIEDEEGDESDEEEWEVTLEEHIEKLSAKIENLHSTMRIELTELSDQMKENHKEDIAKRKKVEEKIERMFDKMN